MTISTATNKVTYTGDTSTVAFAYPYFFFANSEIRVDIKNTTTDVVTAQVLDTDFTVTGAGDRDLTGTITFSPVASSPNPPATTEQVIIYREVALTQESDYVDYNTMPSQTIEDSLDRLTMIAQDLQRQIDNTIAQASGSEISGIEFPLPTADKVIGWNDAETGLENKSLTTTSTDYSGEFTAGLDASKSGSPSTDDIYVATDTGILYICFASPTWTAYGSLLDEDNMASDSATKAPSQQSVKAYVDSGTVTMTNKTLTSPVLNTGVSGTAVLDEDTMSSDSATKLATQQSIKAYVDALDIKKGLFGAFKGDGSDGAVTISSDTNISTIDDATTPGLIQATSFTINTTKTLTVDTGWAYILCTGTCTITGDIDADEQGEAGGSGSSGVLGQPGSPSSGFGVTVPTKIANEEAVSYSSPVAGCLAGAAGGGAGYNSGSGYWGGAGGGGATYGGNGGSPSAGEPDNCTDSPANQSTVNGEEALLAAAKYRGAGGGGGTGNNTGTGGTGGGCIYIECEELVYTGGMTADGNGPGEAAFGGNGGGGGGGTIIVRANTITTNSGTSSVLGGVPAGQVSSGGNGGGGDGADGFVKITADA